MVLPNITNIPAITSVHECSSDDTGVGPSIASGSHSHVKPITDLKIVTIKSAVNIGVLSGVSVEPEQKLVENVATINPRTTSPIRLKPIAENAEESVKERPIKFPINKKLIMPTDSQKINTGNSVALARLTVAHTLKRKSHKVIQNLENA